MNDDEGAAAGGGGGAAAAAGGGEEEDSQVEVDMAFWCKSDNVRNVATVLSTLLKNKKKDDSQLAYVEITPFVILSPFFFDCYMTEMYMCLCVSIVQNGDEIHC